MQLKLLLLVFKTKHGDWSGIRTHGPEETCFLIFLITLFRKNCRAASEEGGERERERRKGDFWVKLYVSNNGLRFVKNGKREKFCISFVWCSFLKIWKCIYIRVCQSMVADWLTTCGQSFKLYTIVMYNLRVTQKQNY